MRAFGGRFERVLEVDSHNLSREDCSSLNLLRDLKVSDQIPHLVKLNLMGSSFEVAITESFEPSQPCQLSEKFLGI